MNQVSQSERFATKRPIDPEAYRLYSLGMFHLRKETQEGTKMGLDYLHRAIEREPNHPLLFGALAMGFVTATHAPGAPPDAFERVRGILQQRYGALTVVEEDDFRLQTPWVPFPDGDQPGEERATVFREDEATLGVVVERRFLQLSAWGAPRWTSTRGDAERERALGDALAAALR